MEEWSRMWMYLLFERVRLIGKLIISVCFTDFFFNLLCSWSTADISMIKEKRFRQTQCNLNSTIDDLPVNVLVYVRVYLPIKAVRNAVTSHTVFMRFTETVFGLSVRHYINRPISKRQRRKCLHTIQWFYRINSENIAVF